MMKSRREGNLQCLSVRFLMKNYEIAWRGEFTVFERPFLMENDGIRDILRNAAMKVSWTDGCLIKFN